MHTQSAQVRTKIKQVNVTGDNKIKRTESRDVMRDALGLSDDRTSPPPAYDARVLITKVPRSSFNLPA